MSLGFARPRRLGPQRRFRSGNFESGAVGVRQLDSGLYSITASQSKQLVTPASGIPSAASISKDVPSLRRTRASFELPSYGRQPLYSLSPRWRGPKVLVEGRVQIRSLDCVRLSSSEAGRH